MTEIRATDYFAIVPEFVLYAPISSNAVRLFAVLHRYANTNLKAWPSRKTLADAMGVSTATIDRAKDELVEIGALLVENRISDLGDPTSNLYTLRMAPGSSGMMKGLLRDEGTRPRRDDDLRRVRKIQSHKGESSSRMRETNFGSQASHVTSLVRMGLDDQAIDYIDAQDPSMRDFLRSTMDQAKKIRENRG